MNNFLPRRKPRANYSVSYFLPSAHNGHVLLCSCSILAFTLEQYIAVCGDYSRRFHMSDRTNKYVLGIWICSVLYCAPWLGLTQVQPDADDHTRQQCELRLTRETYIGFFGADLLLFYVLPLIIALFVYTKIVLVLFKSARYCSRGSPCLSLSRSNLNEAASNSNSQQVSPVPHYTKGLPNTTSATMLFGRVLNHQVSENTEERRSWLVQSRSQVRGRINPDCTIYNTHVLIMFPLLYCG